MDKAIYNFLRRGVMPTLQGSIGAGPAFIDNNGKLSPWYNNKLWFVDKVNGSATNSGTSWDQALTTVTLAYAKCSTGDTIFVRGTGATATTYLESIDIILRGIKIIGCSESNNDVVWTGVAAAAITITGVTDCYIGNIRPRPASGYAGISLIGAASYATIEGCRFQGTTGSKYGIVSDGRQSGVKILGNDFRYMNTTSCYGIYAPIYGTTAEAASWDIIGNNFHSNTYHLKGNLRYSLIEGNKFSSYGLNAAGAQAAPTKCLDLTPASGSVGNNQVTKNTFGGAYTTALYVSASATEDWIGNYAAVTGTTAPYGLTVAIPAT